MKNDITFSKEDIDYFNRKVGELVKLLHPEPREEGAKPRKITSGKYALKENLNFPISDVAKYAIVNGMGIETSRYFPIENNLAGLSDDFYSKFEIFSHKIISHPSLRNIVSEDYVKDVLFRWLELTYKKEISEDKTFVNYLIEKTTEAVLDRRIALPIANLEIEKPFSIGNVVFGFFTKDLFDKISEKIETNSADEEESKKKFLNRIRKKYQGAVFTSISIESEIEKSIEIAKRETEMVLMILRFFSPSSIFPSVPCYYGMIGKVFIPQMSVFIFENDLPIITERIEEKRQFNRIITDKEFQSLRRMGLDKASNLIKKKDKNEFEELIINCMYIFSRGIVSKGFQDKLVFTLVSVETLLLGNTSESIQSTVGSRLALLHTSKSKIQKEIKQIVKNAYRLRSAYLHHGIRKYDIQLLANLQQIVWHALRKSLIDSSNYLTKAEFLTSI